MDAISAFGLSKQFGNKTALHNLTLHISPGEKYAIAGPEGCGKTIALRMFAALMIPSVGECSVFGYSPLYDAEKIHKLTGTVMETSSLYSKMTVRDNLRFFAGLYNLDDYDSVDRISFLLHKLDIWETRDKTIDKIPTNAIQRVHLARALLHSPRLLLMDEPAQGMDLETIEVVNSLIEHINTQENVTVLVSTRHFLHAQKFCNQYAVMNSGVVSASGDIETLRRRCGLSYKAKFTLSSSSPPPPEEFTKADDGSWYVKINLESEMPKLIFKLTQAKCELHEAVIERPTLIDVYERLYQYGMKGSDFIVSEISEPKPEKVGEIGAASGKDTEEEPGQIVAEQGTFDESKGDGSENKNMVSSGSVNSEERPDSNVEL